MVRNVDSQHGGRAALRPAKAFEKLYQGGLAGAVGAEDSEDLTATGVEGCAGERLEVPIGLPQLLDPDRHGRLGPDGIGASRNRSLRQTYRVITHCGNAIAHRNHAAFLKYLMTELCELPATNDRTHGGKTADATA